MELKEIKEKQKAVKLAGGIILFMGTICSLLFLLTLLSNQEEYIQLLIPLLAGGIIYTPLGYFALYKQNRWVIFSVLILLVLKIISNLLVGGGGGIILILIILPIYKGAEAAFKLHAHSMKIKEK